jgi:hypothetical protein
VSSNYQTKKENKIRQRTIMTGFTQQDKIEISKILTSIEGRLDKRLIKLTTDLILKTNWTKNVAISLYKNNLDSIPDKSLNAFVIGSHFGQIYQITLDFSKKLELSLSPNQKNILREFVFFLVLLRAEKQTNNDQH